MKASRLLLAAAGLAAGTTAVRAWHRSRLPVVGRGGGSSAGREAGVGRQVVLATRLYAPEPAAAALRLRGLARALAEQGAQVTVVTSTPPGARAPQDAGVRVRSWPALRDASGYIRGYVQYLSFDLPLALRLMVGPRPELIVCEPPPTTGMVVRAVTEVRRVPYAYYAADVWSDAAASSAPGWVVAALRAVESRVLAGARPVLAVSDGVAQRVRELGAQDVEVVPNGIDTSVFTGEGPVSAEAPEAPYFLYAGTASEWQGAGVFIEALRQVHRRWPQARLVFLGQGSDWPRLAELADDDPRVMLHELVPAEEAASWQRGAVASVVSIRPGQGYDFAYPTKIFAALACGTPVVYAGPGPARDDLPAYELGWACDYEPQAVAEAMEQALEQWQAGQDAPEQRRARAAARREWVLAHRSMQAAAQQAAQRLLG